LTLQENSPGIYGFESSKFYPLDGMGWNDTAIGADGGPHNFLFTTEIHTQFQYHANQTFSFRGDDDLWLFINGRLAIDLGGVHMPAEQVVNLGQIAATFGLVEGQTYKMDIFHAERRPNGSNFKVQTSISCFTDPG